MSFELLLNSTLLLMILFMAIMIVCSQDLLKALVYMSVFSLLMAMEYLVLAAPDVSLTEASVGVCLSTVLFLSSFLILGDKEKDRINFWYAIPLVVIYVATIIMLADMPLFGAVDAVTNKHVSTYYIQNTQQDFNMPNIVTAILAGYRAFDTLGELAVIFTAAIAVFAIVEGKLNKN